MSCPASARRFEEASARFGAGAVVAAVGGVAGGEVDRKRVNREDVLVGSTFVVSTDVGSEGVISGAGMGFEAVSDVAGK
jgi:hypothetical protein